MPRSCLPVVLAAEAEATLRGPTANISRKLLLELVIVVHFSFV
jgi:hypothetical protein